MKFHRGGRVFTTDNYIEFVANEKCKEYSKHYGDKGPNEGLVCTFTLKGEFNLLSEQIKWFKVIGP